ncbi:cell cycle regulator of non-homologous end joining isoform X1 [Falco peregrinus]|uniref:cell cycle regulator of non-homologous end joining isoform X1 n=1 Tax=Falco peregrinus TaxID=8954 RepID=UPI002478D4B8|nr:cell cycle regulator of non-homologous end joining isoform X1 [Falco peregrinus]
MRRGRGHGPPRAQQPREASGGLCRAAGGAGRGRQERSPPRAAAAARSPRRAARPDAAATAPSAGRGRPNSGSTAGAWGERALPPPWGGRGGGPGIRLRKGAVCTAAAAEPALLLCSNVEGCSPLCIGAAAVVHCMNEAELVDVALAVLAENLDREEEGEEKAPAGSGEERELQPPPSAAPAGTASAGAGSDRGPAPPAPPAPGARAGAALAGWEDSEDDALKYVREIFFS